VADGIPNLARVVVKAAAQNRPMSPGKPIQFTFLNAAGKDLHGVDIRRTREEHGRREYRAATSEAVSEGLVDPPWSGEGCDVRERLAARNNDPASTTVANQLMPHSDSGGTK
jgi:hypothetical protein